MIQFLKIPVEVAERIWNNNPKASWYYVNMRNLYGRWDWKMTLRSLELVNESVCDPDKQNTPLPTTDKRAIVS
jgi:hypothetical protein